MSNEVKREYQSNYVPALRDPAPRIVEVDIPRDLPASPTTVLMPHAGYEDRAKGFGIATAPLAGVAGLVAALVGILEWQVMLTALATLLLALGGFSLVWLIAYVAYTLISTVARKGEIAKAAPQRHTALRHAAEALSRKNVDAALVELFMEAVQRLTLLAYEVDAEGYCNIDAITGRLLIPAPWGRSGHKRWGITPSESVILRKMIQQRQIGKRGRGPGRWIYDHSQRTWRLNLYDFDTLADGQRYWQRWPLTVQEYRQARSKRLGDR